MTLEEKITRYHSIPKRITELNVDKCICESVWAIRYDSIGEAKGTPGNTMEKKMLDAASISLKINVLKKEYGALKMDILQEINDGVPGDTLREVYMRTILKEKLLYGHNFNYIANKIVHTNRKLVSALYHEGCSILKIPPSIPIDSHRFPSIPLETSQIV